MTCINNIPLRLNWRIPRDHNLRPYFLDQISNLLSILYIIEPSPEKCPFIVDKVKVYPFKREPDRVRVATMKTSLGTRVPPKIGVGYLMPSTSKFSAQLDLKRMPGVIMNQNSHMGPM